MNYKLEDVLTPKELSIFRGQIDKYRRVFKIKNTFKRTEILENIAESIFLIVFLGAIYWINCNVKI